MGVLGRRELRQVKGVSPVQRPPVTIPRWMSALVWWVGVPVVHGGVPWAISRLGVRHGWSADHPAAWNLVGLAAVAGGATLTLWVSLAHLSKAKDGVEVSVMSR